jgi:hypothetical protein
MRNISEYQIFKLAGNKKTKSGDQVEEIYYSPGRRYAEENATMGLEQTI